MAALARGRDLFALLDGGGERLLDQHVDACLRESQRGRQVLLGRQRHDGEVERTAREQLIERPEHKRRIANSVVAIPRRIDRTGELHAGQRLEDAGVVAAHHAEPERGCAQHGQQVTGACRRLAVRRPVRHPRRVGFAPMSAAPGLVLSPSARVGADVVFGANVVVHDGVEIGDGAIVGDQAYVRERATIGERTVIGRGSAVDNDVVVGSRVRIQTSVYLTAFSVIEDDVFVGPCAMTTNDDAMGRVAPGTRLHGGVPARVVPDADLIERWR